MSQPLCSCSFKWSNATCFYEKRLKKQTIFIQFLKQLFQFLFRKIILIWWPSTNKKLSLLGIPKGCIWLSKWFCLIHLILIPSSISPHFSFSPFLFHFPHCLFWVVSCFEGMRTHVYNSPKSRVPC